MNPERRQYFAELIARGNNQEVLCLLADIGQAGSDAQSMRSFFCGVASQNLGQLGDAAAHYEEASERTLADLLQIWNNLAGVQFNRSNFAEAASVVEQLRSYQSYDADLLSLHVLALKEMGDMEGAQREARQFVERLPRSAAGARWLVHILWRNKRYLEALLCTSDIPLSDWGKDGLGHELIQCLIELGLLDVAEAMLPVLYGSDYDPLDSEELCAGVGLLAFLKQDLGYARRVFESGLALGYKNNSIVANLGFAQLTEGDFENGWHYYLGRNEGGAAANYLNYEIPRWNGESLSGKTLLLVSEQGLGDVIQFLRFVPQMESLGARVVFVAFPDIVGLLANDPSAKKIAVQPLAISDIHYHAQLLDLPCRLGIKHPKDVPCSIPYLYANTQKSAEWQAALETAKGIRVGLVWAGNPSHAGDHYRSASINIFAPLAGIPGVMFFGLQKGEGIKEAKCAPEGLDFEWLGDQFANFDDTAAAIANLDLVISVDTSVAHLAAALGKPVWMLASLRNPDWRWTDYGHGNAWYPNLQVFRQEIADDWLALVKKQIRPKLAELLQKTGSDSGWMEFLWAVDASPIGVEYLAWGDWAKNVVKADVLEKVVNWGRRWLEEGGEAKPIESLFEVVKNEGLDISQSPHFESLWACLFFKTNREEAAIQLCEDIQTKDGTQRVDRWTYVLWGFYYFNTGNFVEACEVWKAACLAYPLDGHLYYLAALAYRDCGNKSKAIEGFRQAIECSPRHRAAHLALGSMLLETDSPQGLLHLQKSIMLNVNYSKGWQQIVNRLHEKGLYMLAEHILQDRCGDMEKFGQCMLHIQNLVFQGRDAEARQLMPTVHESVAESVSDQRTYGINLFRLGNQEESFAFLAKLVEQYPYVRENKTFLGHSLLRAGKSDPGWLYYWQGLRRWTLRFPEWQGESLDGKTLLLTQDQGMGDVIQFLPILLEVAALGPRRMVFAVSPALVNLVKFQGVPYEVVDGEKFVWDDYRFDYQVEIMALPYLMKVDLQHPRSPQPTLQAPEKLVPKWEERLQADRYLKVGLVWAGGGALGHDYLRSSPLSEWSELWQVEGVSFYSLQKDAPSNQAAVFHLPLHNLAADCPTFLHTSSIIQSLDLVITVDTAVAHLSASLNRTTWILLSDRYTDFRWMQGRDDCPWYPSVRLFRKRPNEVWRALLARVSDALIEAYPSLSRIENHVVAD